MIRPIQYLRGIAAMMVVWHHALAQVAGTQNFIRLPQFGAYGVDLFFAISGFIMLVTTWDKDITPLEFAKHRIRRIVPLYWLATLLMVCSAIVAPLLFKTLRFDADSLLKSLFFIPYYSLSFPGLIQPLLVPGWSLNYEIFFYGLFALLLTVNREWRVRLMVGAMSILVVTGYVLHPGSAAFKVYTNPILLEFAAGMIAGRLWLTMKKDPHRDGGSAFMTALGDASYSIYLTHVFVLGILRVLWVRLVPAPTMESSVALMALSLIVCALSGWLCFLWIEGPMNRWFAKSSAVVPARTGVPSEIPKKISEENI